MIRSASETVESGTVRQSMRHVVHDVVTLAELQGRLFQSDSRELGEHIVRPLAVFLGGLLCFAATVPVALLAIAECLVAAGVPRAAAYVLVTVGGLGAAAGMATWARHRFRAMPPPFARSREELACNLSWIKETATELAANRREDEASSSEDGQGSRGHWGPIGQ